MKSSRESALNTVSSVKPGKVAMPKEALQILDKLQKAKVYGSKRKYNKELQKLADAYPDMAAQIFQLKVWE